MKNYRDILEAVVKQRYSFIEDGYYSHIVKDANGEFSTFAKAKKYITKYCKQRLDEYKFALSDLPKKEANVLNGEGEYFDVYWDGMYSGVERSKYETGFKNFKEAKKELSDFFKGLINDWTYPWKSSVKLKEEDVEDDM